ncbi:CDK-activating kinase assembly factor MAT1-like [Ctenocephalides felis]|uniref:CDK-activating kinase assembly factor MAT1-like n=1 Tax=Ctenocephalides felis TaxID=7515 RepID=UPI000E6E4093|nr:CDK-activating kinase assembly factor MAT1-like [Ctenocephalides felis]XP_026477963.1 CDK-activating kinase assembly factor MAT1-like [Ctenocephalides felis]XP_026477964.1 CDK-activating kinase assembly factor MAT1-like [Ctenocephalides felis]XP_026478274.1 CDK-activating kinase assembly factor MAT1-like [Ctenocephalides felis]
MDDQACPRCKTTKYRNPSLKLMVNVCGHALCENCVDLLFLKGSGSCPDCNVPLRRSNFRVQMFEDPMVEKEVDIRRKVIRDFNKKEEDFASLAEYNDYLEQIETIIYNLVNNIDVLNTNKLIEQYKKDNREIILKNKSKIGREEYELEEMLEMEKRHEELRQQQILLQEQETAKKKQRAKDALIDELMFSHGDAKDIVKTFATKQEQVKEELKEIPKITQFSTGIQFGRSGQHQFLPVPQVEEGPLYQYTEFRVNIEGPMPPTFEELDNLGFIKHVRSTTTTEKAGGYTAQLACRRALESAQSGLYFQAV